MTNTLFHVLIYRDETVEAIEGSNSNENGGEGTEDVVDILEARSALCSGIRTNCFACVVSDDEEQEEIHQSNLDHSSKPFTWRTGEKKKKEQEEIHQSNLDHSSKPFTWRTGEKKKKEQEEIHQSNLDHSSKPFTWRTGEKKKKKKKKEEEEKQIYKVVLGLAHLGETHSEPSHWRSNPSLSNPPNHLHGELVAAGWPSWLSAVAGGAIYGWVPRQPDTFENLTKIGKGRRSYVYKARDTLTGKTVALKKVRFNNLKPESVKLLAREILVLRRLDHSNVIKLEGLVSWKMSSSLYLVFEHMEHDLSGLAEDPGIKFTEPQVKCYMHQLLLGLEYCHSHGVLHRDINGSNILIDNGGILKIAGFGSASFFDPNCKLPMTSCVTTLWYRPPELLMGANDYGVGVDLWSMGCVLAELLAGKPIMPGQKEMEQLHMIFMLCGSPSEEFRKKSKLLLAHVFKPGYKRCIRETFKDFIPSSLPLIEALLAIDPVERQTATVALRSEFFTTEPYACEPSRLPKYPSKKCMDAKRDKKTRLPSNGGQRSGGNSNDGLKETRQLDRAVKTLCHSEADVEIQLLVK